MHIPSRALRLFPPFTVLIAAALCGCSSDDDSTGGSQNPSEEGGSGGGGGTAGDGAAGGGAGGGTAGGGTAGDGAGGGSTVAEPFDIAGCEGPTATAGQSVTVPIQHDGQDREYILYVPPGVDTSEPTPVVVNWHGLTSAADQQQFLAGNAIADERGYIVAYPNGLGDPGAQSFNGGVCCSQLGTPPHTADDVGFGRAIVADVAEKLCVDKKRVYSTGMSNGGYMTEHNACEAADFYAAFAPVSALGIARDDCTPSRPVPFIAFNGTEDPLVSYDVSRDRIAYWVGYNNCNPTPSREDFGDSYCETYDECDDGVRVVSCTITGMNHCWPGNELVIPGFCESGGLTDISANEQMYDFFERFALP